MSLSATLNTASTSLATNAALSTLVARNIAGVNDPNYSRKSAELVTTVGSGSVSVGTTRRAADAAVLAKLLSANGDAASAKAMADGLDRIESTVNLTATATAAGATATDTSPSTLLAALQSALQTYAATPSNQAAGQAVVSAAKTLTANLNGASATVQSVRAGADAGIVASVKTVNGLLGQYATADAAVQRATATGTDATDALDTRDAILKQLSGEVGIVTVPSAGGSLSIYTDSGVTLFQDTPRTVAVTATTAFAAGSVGSAVTIDGVDVTGPGSPMPIRSGTLFGLAQLRDTTTVAYQNQLDQVAQGLISAFADTDQTNGGAPPIAGLFTAPGSSTAQGSATAGVAGLITVNANVDPSQGGKITRLRDGNTGDPGNSAYNANPGNNASYAGHLQALLTSFGAARSFDPASGGSDTGSITAYADSSISWLEARRKDATAIATSSSATQTAAVSSLSNATGVNLDDELLKMTDLEHSYSASAQLLSTVKSMFDTLLSAVR